MNDITSDTFLLLLRKNQKFSDYVINNYPVLEADVRSYREDPNCSCKNKIAKFFDSNKDSVTTRIQFWANETGTSLNAQVRNPNHRNVLKPTLPFAEQSLYKDVIGEIVEISPDPNEFKRIISIAREEWLYNGINTLETIKFDPQTKKESVVWLLLFY